MLLILFKDGMKLRIILKIQPPLKKLIRYKKYSKFNKKKSLKLKNQTAVRYVRCSTKLTRPNINTVYININSHPAAILTPSKNMALELISLKLEKIRSKLCPSYICSLTCTPVLALFLWKKMNWNGQQIFGVTNSKLNMISGWQHPIFLRLGIISFTLPKVSVTLLEKAKK